MKKEVVKNIVIFCIFRIFFQFSIFVTLYYYNKYTFKLKNIYVNIIIYNKL